ncbi:hypothetical protein B296_00051428 [Ensete ventricosum]|uniref:POX domain-containing protein n=1 Tax=Ensete ventricosum TaxID=4639 RepID=A0A426Y4E1_ENSVE|nr:hypothetical protein B296_00051428 [Ensete ventricosum]
MGIATQPSQHPFSYLSPPRVLTEPLAGPTSPTSMSQGFHQGIFNFSQGFDRSASQEQQQHHHHIAQHSRRDKLRVQDLDVAGHPLVPIGDQGDETNIYESAAVGAGNMLSDMFNFPATGPTAIDLHANQISGGYHFPPRPAAMPGFSGDWYGLNRQESQQQQQQHPVTGLSTDSAAAMQLFLTNPPLQPPPHQRNPRSSSPSLPAPPPTFHHQHQDFRSLEDSPFGGRAGEGQGLSLSLSSSLQQLEMAKADDLRVRQAALYLNNQQQNQQQPTLHLQGHHDPGAQVHGHGQQLHMGYSSTGVVNVLRNSRYTKAAQELLEEFCSVGRGQLKGSRVGRYRGSTSNTNRNPSGGGGGVGAGAGDGGASATSSKDVPPLSPADRFEHQRKKTKLISMLDEARTDLSFPTCSMSCYQ